MRIRSFAFALLLVPVPAFAGDLVPRLVRDVDLTSYAVSSSPRQLAGVRKGFAFTAFGNRELWSYDDEYDSFSRQLRRQEIRRLGGNLYAAREAAGGWTLWLAGGWPAFQAFAASREPLAAVGTGYGSVGYSPSLFEARDSRGWGLWAFGSAPPETTAAVARPLPFPDGHLLRDFTDYRGRAFFIARHRTLGTALWSSDGTPAGTSVLFAPSPGETVPMILAGVVGGRLLLVVSGGGRAHSELWASDGTPRGTRPLARLDRAGRAAVTAAVVFRDDQAFLVAGDSRHGKQLWVTDGTAAGTRRLTRFTASDPFGGPLASAPLATRFAFFADDGVHGRELWWTDGTAAGTRLVPDACPGACGTAGQPLTTVAADPDGAHPEILFFSAETPGTGRELWVSDGAAAGTRQVSDLCPGPCSGDPDEIAAAYFTTTRTGATFTAAAPEGARALWFSDGSPGGTQRLTPPGTAVTSNPIANLFTASDVEFGDEFWTTEGTPETTRLWRDVGREQDSGSHPVFLGTAGGDQAVFTAFTAAHGRRLWTSDGTAAGTLRLPVPQPDPDVTGAPTAASVAGRTFFAAPPRGSRDHALWAAGGIGGDGVTRLTPPGLAVTAGPFSARAQAVFFARTIGTEDSLHLWVSGGTAESTQALALPGAPFIQLDLDTPLVLLQGRLLFRRIDDNGHLWISDGTVAGTGRLLDTAPFLEPLDRVAKPVFAEFQGKLYFLGSPAAGLPPQLWVSDWTAAGTKPLGIPGAGHTVSGLFPASSHLFFTAVSNGDNGFLVESLWVTDGTAGTAAELPVTVSGEGTIGTRPAVFGSRLAFSDEQGYLWVTDGSTTGTFPLRDPAGREIAIGNGHATAFAGRLVAVGHDPFGDDEPTPCFVWDGTGATAAPASGVLCTGDLLLAGSRLYVSGFEPHTGAEPWVFEERP